MPAHSRVPDIGDALPRSGGSISRALGRGVLGLLGWRIEGTLPNVAKAVVIVAPHTSNWDFVIGIAAKFALGLRAAWLGKNTLFRGPLGPVMRWLGGIPVDRSKPHDVVAQTVARFAGSERLVLGISPEGTRKAVARWRMGFYHIACGAAVPIVPVAFDWSRHALVIGPPLVPSDDPDADLAALAACFAPARGRRGELTSPPR
ncbi:MAG: 1-acyl-sn-glycerol-3-phosphate acyltransferase [Gemmatimonadaceae bacterium]|nr:1-acyl-sn-glycerol-3-phosphate acyltransferase [Gemmatimonadaceae bacterium]